MNYGKIIHIIGVLLQVEGTLMFLSVIVAWIYGEDCWMYLCATSVGAGILGTLLRLKKMKREKFHAKEGFVITAICWVVLSVVGALPFFFSGAIPSFTDAVF